MTIETLAPRAAARQKAEKALALSTRPAAAARLLIEAALDLKPRGALLEALREAHKAATGERATDLTDADYRALRVGGTLVDPDRPGLVMRHGRRTGRVWIFRYSHPSTFKQVEMQFGSYPALNLADARSIWRSLREQRNAGKTPTTPGSDGGPAPASVMTVGDLARRYVADYARKVKRTSSVAEDEALLGLYVLPHFADTPVAAFDAATVASILAPLHERAPRQAEKLRALVSTMFNVARGRRKGTPRQVPRPVPRGRTRPDRRCVKPEGRYGLQEEDCKAGAREDSAGR